jgi:hypothetical protein
MTNNQTIRLCKFCGTKPVAMPQAPGSLFCGERCVNAYQGGYSTDDGYDAWRDSQYDVYDPKDWRWGSWDK